MEKETNEIQKPITVAREEFVTQIASLINDSGLPPFIIEPVLKDMLLDVRAVAKRQLEADTKRYHEMLASISTTDANPDIK